MGVHAEPPGPPVDVDEEEDDDDEEGLDVEYVEIPREVYILGRVSYKAMRSLGFRCPGF